MSRRGRNTRGALRGSRALPFQSAQKPLPQPLDSTFFVSGASRVPDIMGLTALGFPIGVSAPECAASCEHALKRLAKDGWMPVFIDSGAVAEREKINNRWVTTAPISDEEWRERLALYDRLAKVLGVPAQDEPRLYAVAPDKLGSQSGTLRRLTRYRPELQQLVRRGVYLLVPLQPGRMSLSDFWVAAVKAMGGNPRTGGMRGSPMVAGAPPLIPAIPMRTESGVTVEDLEEFLARWKPRRVHLLGIGPRSSRWPAVLGARQRASPRTRILHDANVIRAFAAKDLPFTERQKTLMRASPALAYLGDLPFGEAKFDDLYDQPSVYMTRSDLEKFATMADLSLAQRRQLYPDPDAFFQGQMYPDVPGHRWLDEPEVILALGKFWDLDRMRKLGFAVRVMALGETFAHYPGAGQYDPMEWPELDTRWQPRSPGRKGFRDPTIPNPIKRLKRRLL